MIPSGGLWWDLVLADMRSLNGFCHRICLTEKRVMTPCLGARPLPAPRGPVRPSPVMLYRSCSGAEHNGKCHGYSECYMAPLGLSASRVSCYPQCEGAPGACQMRQRLTGQTLS